MPRCRAAYCVHPVAQGATGARLVINEKDALEDGDNEDAGFPGVLEGAAGRHDIFGGFDPCKAALATAGHLFELPARRRRCGDT